MQDQKPSVGRIVHYVNAGRDIDGSTMCATAEEQQPGDAKLERGTWHWPERVK